MRRISGIRLPIARQKDCADDILDGHDRIKIKRLLGTDDFDLQTKTTRHGSTALQLFEPFGVCRQAQGSVLAKTGCLARQVFQFGVEIGGVLRQPR